MTIHFHCGCGQKLKATAASIGKHFDCPVCGASVVVPETDEDAAAASATHAPATASIAVSGTVSPAKPKPRKTESSASNGAPKLPDEHPAADRPVPGRDAHKVPAANDTQELLAESDTVLATETETQVAAPSADRSPDQKRRRSGDDHNGRPSKTSAAGKSSLLDTPFVTSDDAHADPPYRRTYASDSAQDHVAADTARDLFKLVRKMKKEDKPPEKVKKKPVKSDEERFDFGGLLKELGTTVLPGALAIFAACFGAYWIASAVMSSGRQLPELGDVYGVVTLDGKPLPHASILFRPVADDPDTLSRISASTAMTDEQGRYELSYVEDVSGAAVGAHEVVISAPLPNGRERLRRIYNSATTLVREVQSGNNELNFELTSK